MRRYQSGDPIAIEHSARLISGALFGIRHFSKEANASERCRRLHIYGVVECQTKGYSS